MQTPADIIARSLTLHPTLFAEALRTASHTHGVAAASMRHHSACETARRLANACTTMAQRIESQPPLFEDDARAVAADFMASGMDYWISALNIAARLQCLPPSAVSAAVEALDA